MRSIHFPKGSAWDTPTRTDQKLHLRSFKALLLFLSLISVKTWESYTLLKGWEKESYPIWSYQIVSTVQPLPPAFHSVKLSPWKTGWSDSWGVGFVNQSSPWPALKYWENIVMFLVCSPMTSSLLKPVVNFQSWSFLSSVALDRVDHSCLLEGLSYLGLWEADLSRFFPHLTAYSFASSPFLLWLLDPGMLQGPVFELLYSHSLLWWSHLVSWL